LSKKGLKSQNMASKNGLFKPFLTKTEILSEKNPKTTNNQINNRRKRREKKTTLQ
jgi:hypothetical protein